MVREPGLAPDGTPLAPRNIFQTEGFTDTFTPNPAIEAFATALGGDIVQLPDAVEIQGLTLRQRAIRPTPFENNLDGATAVLAQYRQASGSDGHFVVFDIANAERQAAEFLGTPRAPAPRPSSRRTDRAYWTSTSSTGRLADVFASDDPSSQ
jgi:hypothetical protein